MTDDVHDSFAPEPEEEPDRAEPSVTRSSTGIAWGAIVLLLGIALIVVFSVQNTEPVPVQFLWIEGEFSLAIVILVSVGLVILLTEVIGLSYRRRRRRRRAENEELKRYRTGS